MYPPTARRAALPVLVLTASLALALPAQAAPATGARDGASVAAVTDGLARNLAAAIADPATRSRVTAAVTAGPVDLASLLMGTPLASSRAAADQAVRIAKGLPAGRESLLRVRLGDASMRAALDRGVVPLVAAAPSDDETTAVTAYDPAGGKVLLDPDRAPLRPVLVVEVDTARALPLGMRVVEQALTARHVGPAVNNATLAGGYWTTKINAVSSTTTRSPGSRATPRSSPLSAASASTARCRSTRSDAVPRQRPHDVLPQPAPGELLGYKYNLADAVMMEDDGDTNYLRSPRPSPTRC